MVYQRIKKLRVTFLGPLIQMKLGFRIVQVVYQRIKKLPVTFLRVLTIYVLSKNKKNIIFFLLKIFIEQL